MATLVLACGTRVSAPASFVARSTTLSHAVESVTPNSTPEVPLALDRSVLEHLLVLDALLVQQNELTGAASSHGRGAAVHGHAPTSGVGAEFAEAVRNRLLCSDATAYWRSAELAAVLEGADFLSCALLAPLVDVLCGAMSGLDADTLRARLGLPDDLSEQEKTMVTARLTGQEALSEFSRDQGGTATLGPLASLPLTLLVFLMQSLQSLNDVRVAAVTCSTWAAAALRDALLTVEYSHRTLAPLYASLPPSDATSEDECKARHIRIFNAGYKRSDGGDLLTAEDVVLTVSAGFSFLRSGGVLTCEQLSFVAATCAWHTGKFFWYNDACVERRNQLVADGAATVAASAGLLEAAVVPHFQAPSEALLTLFVAAFRRHASACVQAKILLDSMADDRTDAPQLAALPPLSAAICAAVRTAASAAPACAAAAPALAALDAANDVSLRAWLGETGSSAHDAVLLVSRHRARGDADHDHAPLMLVLPAQTLRHASLLHRVVQVCAALSSTRPIMHVPCCMSGTILEKVNAWAAFHSDQSHPTAEAVLAFDTEFVKVDHGMLFELILAARALKINPLLDLICQTVADMIRGKSPQEIRLLFNIENDLTPEEEEEMRRENQWAYE